MAMMTMTKTHPDINMIIEIKMPMKIKTIVEMNRPPDTLKSPIQLRKWVGILGDAFGSASGFGCRFGWL
jgi:hypothetical protein